MAKVPTSTDAPSNDSATEPTAPRIIAEWVGDAAKPRMFGFSKRTLTKKQVKEHLLMELTRDLVWGKETHYRADVSAESEAFIGWLEEQKEFKVTREE